MYCSNCGKLLEDGAVFCPFCGNRVGAAPAPAGYYPNPGYMYDRPPKKPSTVVPFLLGMFLNILGVILAVIVYNGNDGPYTKNPTTHALLWSLIGAFIWVPALAVIFLMMMGAR